MKSSLAILSYAIALSGCAQLNSAVDWLDQPKVQTAVATIRTVSTAIVCDISSGSQLALAIEQQAAAKKAIATTSLVYTASTLVCQKLSGAAVGTANNVPAVTAVQ